MASHRFLKMLSCSCFINHLIKQWTISKSGTTKRGKKGEGIMNNKSEKSGGREESGWNSKIEEKYREDRNAEAEGQWGD